MNEHQRYTPEELALADDADIDTGQPVMVLAEFGEDVDDAFLDRVRRRIDRQLTTNDFLSLFWELPRLLLFEVLEWFSDPNSSSDKDGTEGGPAS